MRRFIFLTIILLLLSFSVRPAVAEPPCEPGASCSSIYTIAPLVALKDTVPYAWLRSEPNSSASIVYTITAHGWFNLHPERIYETD